MRFYSSKYLPILNIVKTEWDVSRFANRVKNSRVDASGKVSAADEKLKEYFKESFFGDLNEPTTILDQYGCVMVWALPGLLHSKRIVSYYSFLADHLKLYLSRKITIQLLQAFLMHFDEEELMEHHGDHLTL
jgi:hypothetical protein